MMLPSVAENHDQEGVEVGVDAPDNQGGTGHSDADFDNYVAKAVSNHSQRWHDAKLRCIGGVVLVVFVLSVILFITNVTDEHEGFRINPFEKQQPSSANQQQQQQQIVVAAGDDNDSTPTIEDPEQPPTVPEPQPTTEEGEQGVEENGDGTEQRPPLLSPTKPDAQPEEEEIDTPQDQPQEGEEEQKQENPLVEPEPEEEQEEPPPEEEEEEDKNQKNKNREEEEDEEEENEDENNNRRIRRRLGRRHLRKVGSSVRKGR